MPTSTPSNQVILYLPVVWQNPSPTVPIFLQATQAASYQQKVQVQCSQLGINTTKESTTGTSFGTQYLNQVQDATVSQGETLQFTVTCWYYKNNAWQPSSVVAQNSLQLGEYGYMAMALANDGGSDSDYNDTVVLISMYNQSND